MKSYTASSFHHFGRAAACHSVAQVVVSFKRTISATEEEKQQNTKEIEFVGI